MMMMMRGRLTLTLLLILLSLVIHGVTSRECHSADGLCDNEEHLEEDDLAGNDDDDEDEASDGCHDQHERCSRWQALGECKANPVDMHKWCARSCGRCDHDPVDIPPEDACIDQHRDCKTWGKAECVNNPHYMLLNCPKSCKSCNYPFQTQEDFDEVYPHYLQSFTRNFGALQTVEGQIDDHVLRRIESTILYLESDQVKQLPAKHRRACKNNRAFVSGYGDMPVETNALLCRQMNNARFGRQPPSVKPTVRT